MGIAKLKIDLGAVLHNFNYYKSLLEPETKIMIVSKASSYGNGELDIVQLLASKNVDYLAVALTEEGVFFRENGVKTNILVLLTDKQDFEQIIEHCLEPSIYSLDILQSFIDFLKAKGLENYPIHLKFDTGMNRLGFKSDQHDFLQDLSKEKVVFVKSVFSHLLASELEEKDEMTFDQIEKFESIKDKISGIFEHRIMYHLLNTRGISRFPIQQYDMVRLGIGLYGYSGLAQDNLKNVSTFLVDILQIKKVNPGEVIGYGGDNPQDKNVVIAILSVGYADGLSRLAGNGQGHVVINDHRCPFIGNICMDISMVDVTGIPCKVGDVAEIFGEKMSIKEVAETMESIPYEVFTSVSKRVKRVFVEGQRE